MLSIPNPEELKKVFEICSLNDPYDNNPKVESLYYLAMNEIHHWHFKRSPFYREFSLSKGIDDTFVLKGTSDLERLPYVPADFFKTHEALSIPRDNVYLHLTSSGTTGQKSQIFFDEWTIGSAQAMVDKIFNYYNWTSEKKTDYLLLSYETEKSSHLGTSYTDNFLCKYAPMNRVFTSLRLDGHGGHEFDVWGALRFLEEAASSSTPLRIFGFPAFLYFLVKRMKDRSMSPLQLSKDSLVFLGGGWKKHSGEEIPRSEFRDLVSEYLGIAKSRIRDGYGSVEHCVPYVECEYHHFHLPVWSKVIIRDMNLEKAPYGKAGFLQFLSPYISSVPAHSVMMGDLATLYPSSDCQCSLNTEYFVLHGRAGTQKNKSCAIAAAEILKGRSF